MGGSLFHEEDEEEGAPVAVVAAPLSFIWVMCVFEVFGGFVLSFWNFVVLKSENIGFEKSDGTWEFWCRSEHVDVHGAKTFVLCFS